MRIKTGSPASTIILNSPFSILNYFSFFFKMKILIAPDKFKGSLTAVEVCRAIERGIKKYDPAIETILQPLADGGEGTLEILGNTLDLETVFLTVNDPLFRPVTAFYKKNNHTAFIEMATASGLGLLNENERNCLFTTTYGTGEMILDAIEKGVENIFLFVGGSATNDAGMGMATALGYCFLNKNRNKLKPVGANLIAVNFIDKNALKFDPSNINVTVVCDVKNVLFGKDGAAHIYAPQKGAGASAVQLLDNGLRHFSKIIKRDIGKDVSKVKGGGAAGGLGAGAVAFLNASIRPGIETVMEITAFKKQLTDVDLVITGEGKFDHQTGKGKLVEGVARACREKGIPVAAVCGKLEVDAETLKQMGIDHWAEIMSEGVTLEQAVKEAAGRLEGLVFGMVREIGFVPE